MTTRRETSAAMRRQHHLHQIGAATTEVGRLWKTCTWLAVEARRAGRLVQVTKAVRGLVDRVREGQPLPDTSPGPAATDPNAPSDPREKVA